MKKAFTLLELLVVAVIIGVLAFVVIVNFEKAKAKSRDSQRKADLSKISLALSNYYSDNHAYIVAANFTKINSVYGSKLSSYLPTYPIDPNSKNIYYQYKATTPIEYKLYINSETIKPTDSLELAQNKAGDFFDVSADTAICSDGNPDNKTRLQTSTSATAACW